MEINPKHPVTSALHENWHKVTAAVMMKLQLREITLTDSDLQRLNPGNGDLPTIVMHDTAGVLKLMLFEDEAGAYRYVAEHQKKG